MHRYKILLYCRFSIDFNESYLKRCSIDAALKIKIKTEDQNFFFEFSLNLKVKKLKKMKKKQTFSLFLKLLA